MHTIDYIQKLKEAKFNDEQITAIATILTDIEEKQKTETATKKDIEVATLQLQKEIKNLEIKLLTVYGGGVLLILGFLAKGFHWF